jgi:dipeptidyl aminopeptidase/acylaminoacyl peptidase
MTRLTQSLQRYVQGVFVALALAMVFSASANAQQRFSIQDALSAPFPSDLVGARSGDRVAWIQNDRGSRNIWVAEGPSFSGRQLTAYQGDDGQELSGLQFTWDGDFVLYVRGGAENRGGESPNPTSEPDAMERGIWSVAFAGGAPRKIAGGSGAVVSPDGRTAALARGSQVMTVPLGDDGDEPPEPKRLFTIRGRAVDMAWSPDGTRLAFASARGDHAFVGVYDMESRKVTYMDPSVDQDRAPVWSPAGDRIAFLRAPNRGDALPFQAMRSAHPWSIRVGDPSTGRSREVWRAEEGAGSVFRQVSAQQQLMWGAGDRLVFPWEGDGWTHLYSVSAAGGMATSVGGMATSVGGMATSVGGMATSVGGMATSVGGMATSLTPGAFEVQFVSMTPDGAALVFSSGQDDIDRQHLWRVSVAGGGAELLTPGTGIEWGPVQTESGAVVFLASGGTVPAHAEVVDGAGGQRRWLARASFPSDYPSADMVEPEQVVFSASDGMRIHGQLFRPRDMDEGERRPAMIFFHGGSRRQMLLGFHHRGYYHNAYAFNQYLVNKGYIVLAVNYRSGIGYGMEFREALNYGAQGASEYNDVNGAGLYLGGRDDVDPDRIGLWGGSYGGYLTALGLARASDMFAAGVDLHGVHDWNAVVGNFVPGYDATARSDFAKLAFESSPMAYLDGWKSPVLLIHGDDDRNVPFSESVDLAEALRDRGVDFQQLIFPDEVHGFLLYRSWLRAYGAADGFLEERLMKRRIVSQQ